MKMIYVSHCYGGKRTNKKRIEKIIKKLVEQYPDYCFVSPVHCYLVIYTMMLTMIRVWKYCLALLAV